MLRFYIEFMCAGWPNLWIPSLCITVSRRNFWESTLVWKYILYIFLKGWSGAHIFERMVRGPYLWKDGPRHISRWPPRPPSPGNCWLLLRVKKAGCRTITCVGQIRLLLQHSSSVLSLFNSLWPNQSFLRLSLIRYLYCFVQMFLLT
jgi:hypothetical protein